MATYIGITMTQKANMGAELRQQYYQAIIREGAIPLALPPLPPSSFAPLLNTLSGLLLSGGGDVEPHHYGEAPLPLLGETEPERDSFELALIPQAFRRGLPILAICRGMQALNVALGGTLWQDTAYMPGTFSPHKQQQPPEQGSHLVNITNKHLQEIIGAEKIITNSHHHQAVKKIAPTLQGGAYTEDGLTEALWPIDYRGFCLGVQWHPERLDDKYSHRLFGYFTEQAKNFS